MKYLLIPLFFTIFSTYSQEEMLYDIKTDPMNTFSQMMEALELTPPADITCNDLAKINFKKRSKFKNKPTNTCNWKKLCRVYEKNKGGLTLYQNSKGEKVMSLKSDEIRKEIFNCAAILKIPEPEMSVVDMNSHNTYIAKVQGFIIADIMNDSMSDDAIVQKARRYAPEIPVEEFKKLVKNQRSWLSYERELINQKRKEFLALPKSERKQFISNKLFLLELMPLPLEIMEELNDEYDRNEQRTINIFKDVKKDLIEIVEKSYDKKNPSYEVVLERLKTIRYEKKNFIEFLGTTDCLSPNASYMPNRHSIKICPQLMNSPTEMIATVVAHELAHSIDPCSLVAPLLSAKVKDIESYDNRDYGGDLKDDDTAYFLDVDLYHHYGGNNRLGFKPNMSPGFTASESIFKDEIQCLEKYGTTNIRTNPKHYVKAYLNEGHRYLEKQATEMMTPFVMDELKISKKKLDDPRSFELLRHCTIMQDYHAEGGEVFSDLLASKVLAKRMKEVPLAQRREKTFEGISFFTSAACDDLEFAKTNQALPKACEVKFNKVEKSLWQKIESVFYDTNESPHQSHECRVKDMFMKNPDIASSFGCAPSGEYCGN